ncbi:hypothetical protein [Mycolicibacterium rhodesiae]|uniref:hypothetical protein n=1 Tax=Mycolicibacterium rhodesiae TaxID=36814 RepID=UPI0021F33AE6|nr:hypothetical protein [Mycolicibacterium rhodesiae]
MLALIRYVTGLPGEHNGRLLIAGQMFWQVTHREIGYVLGGLTRYTVGRIMSRLEEAGALECRTPGASGGDQTKAYRAAMCESAHPPLTSNVQNRNSPNQQCADSQQVADLQCANLQGAVANLHTHLYESAHSSSSVELSEEPEEAPNADFVVVDTPKAELPPLVAAVVHVLRTYHHREMTFDDIERALRTHPDETIRNGPAYHALTFAVDSGLAVATANKSRKSGSGMKIYGPVPTTDWQPPAQAAS